MRAITYSPVLMLCLALGLAVVTVAAGAQTPAPQAPAPQAGRPALPGQAPPIPLPDPGVMALAPANGVPSSSPGPSGAATPSVPALPERKDTLTLADVQDKLMVTPDDYWQQQMQLRNASLLKTYEERISKLAMAAP